MRAISLLAVSALIVHAQRPVKVEVIGPAGAVAPGQQATIRIELRDANNRPVAAPKPFQVELVNHLPSDQDESLGSVTVPAGQSSATFTMPAAKTEGFHYVWAKQKELRAGGAYVRVKTPPARAPKGQPIAMKAKAPASKTIRALPGRVWVEAVRNPNIRVTPQPDAPAPQPEPPPPAPQPARYQLALRYSPQRSFLANGKDPATVHAFVIAEDGAPLPGFRINLFDGSGRLNPKPLIIPPGEEEGTATLSYDRIGDVKVEYLTASPEVQLDGDSAISIHFDPPITGLSLQAKPARVSMIDSSSLRLSLVDDEDRPIPAFDERAVSLTIDSGRGVLGKQEITIGAGKAETLVDFTPVWWGPVTVSASTPNLLSAQTQIQVDPPYGLLGLATIGGLMGGLVFVLRHPDSPKWRIPVGAFTGIMLFWAVLFLGLSTLPRAAVLNPISVVMFAALGGWIGTELFEPLLKKIGLGGKPEPAK